MLLSTKLRGVRASFLNSIPPPFLETLSFLPRKTLFVTTKPNNNSDIHTQSINSQTQISASMTYRTLTTLNEQRDAVRVPPGSFRSLKTFPPERHSGLVRRPGGLINVPGRLASAPESPCSRLTKLLLNVTIGRSLGPVQVVISPEKTTGDLIKASLEIYAREKRRPLLPETDPHRFELHYSQFSLESLKRESKLINLGSRNFFLCSTPSTSIGSSCYEEAKKTTITSFPLTKLMDFLL